MLQALIQTSRASSFWGEQSSSRGSKSTHGVTDRWYGPPWHPGKESEEEKAPMNLGLSPGSRTPQSCYFGRVTSRSLPCWEL